MTSPKAQASIFKNFMFAAFWGYVFFSSWVAHCKLNMEINFVVYVSVFLKTFFFRKGI